MCLEKKARNLAFKLHKGQFRLGGAPYITHPEAVVDILREVGIEDENILAAAWLHDVIEDCNVGAGFLGREFNGEISRVVSALTRDVDRKSYNERIANSDYSVKIIKLADTAHNCSGIFSCPDHMIQNKLKDCEELYFNMAQEISPNLYRLLRDYTRRKSV